MTVEHPLFARFLQFSAELSERKGAADHRRALLGGLRGRVLEVGAGSGVTFRHYPPEVDAVLAVEPEPTLRAAAEGAARDAPVAIDVVDGVAGALPGPDASFDAAVVSGVLCSVPDVPGAFAELRRGGRPRRGRRLFQHRAPRPPGGGG